ncbi:MAG: adenylyl-sulfate kinase, partial [Anaerolineae bacterium]|nr:adenylyl-sulfate kinase [Anaerolineae bacterium]NIN98905.1 adenylyl-sulfate kinase [Anaerolineae bacterium]
MSNESKDGFALWLTGLPASGKTSLAHALRLQLAERGIRVALLDSDRLRRILTPQP